MITDGGTDNDITLSASIGTASITAASYGATASSLVYTISGATADNTSLTIRPTYAVGGDGNITDASGNEMLNGETVSGSDAIVPVLLSASYKDTNGDGTVNRIDAVYSEDISGSTFESGDWTFPTNPHTLSVGSGVFSGNTVQITVTGSPANTTVLGTTTVKYTNQGTSNSMTDGTNHAATSSVITVSDAASPVIVSSETSDDNKDGTVDRLTLDFSESVVITDGGTDDHITLSASTGHSKYQRCELWRLLRVHWSIPLMEQLQVIPP